MARFTVLQRFQLLQPDRFKLVASSGAPASSISSGSTGLSGVKTALSGLKAGIGGAKFFADPPTSEVLGTAGAILSVGTGALNLAEGKTGQGLTQLVPAGLQLAGIPGAGLLGVPLAIGSLSQMGVKAARIRRAQRFARDAQALLQEFPQVMASKDPEQMRAWLNTSFRWDPIDYQGMGLAPLAQVYAQRQLEAYEHLLSTSPDLAKTVHGAAPSTKLYLSAQMNRLVPSDTGDLRGLAGLASGTTSGAPGPVTSASLKDYMDVPELPDIVAQLIPPGTPVSKFKDYSAAILNELARRRDARRLDDLRFASD